MRTPPDDTTAGQIATFDQTHASLSGFVDDLIKAYRGIRSEGTSVREVDIAGVSAWLQTTEHDRETFAELLTVAVVRLAEGERS